MNRPVRVLLVSPLRSVDVVTGDVTHTEELLAAPPDGVVYTTYADAARDGTLVEHGRIEQVRGAIGIARLGELVLWAVRQPEMLVRRRGLLFREPARWFSVIPDAFDLVHVHCFSVRWLGPTPPVVVGHALPLEDLYRDAWGWTSRRVRVVRRVERALARLTRTDRFSDGPLFRTTRVVAATPLVADRFVAGGAPADRVSIVPLTTEDPGPPGRQRPDSTGARFGLVAQEFGTKGADRAIEALAEVRRTVPDAELHLVGAPRPDGFPDGDGVVWHGRVERRVLLEELLPTLSALVHPTRMDGLPFVVLEAMSRGVPVITSTYGSMPWVVHHDVAGLVVDPDQPGQLVEAMLRMLDTDERDRLAVGARDEYLARFAPTVVRAALRQVYDDALTAPGPMR